MSEVIGALVVAAAAEGTPLYQAPADDLHTRLTQTLPDTGQIARLYRVPVFTAQFVRRAAATCLRTPGAPPTA